MLNFVPSLRSYGVKTMEDIVKELDKGLENLILWGECWFETNKDGKVRTLSMREIDELKLKIKETL